MTTNDGPTSPIPSMARFILSGDGNVIDTTGRFLPAPACPNVRCFESHGTALEKQICLRRAVLRAQLDSLTSEFVPLHDPETSSLEQVIYETFCVSMLDYTIGQGIAEHRSVDTPGSSLDEMPWLWPRLPQRSWQSSRSR